MTSWAFSFYEYKLTDSNGNAVTFSDVPKIFDTIKQLRAPHRQDIDRPSEFNTLIIRLKHETFLGHNCVVFDIARLINLKIEHTYDFDKDDLRITSRTSNDTQWTRVVLIPKIGKLAIRDGSGDTLAAKNGLRRIKSVVRFHSDYDFIFEEIKDLSDIEATLKTLHLLKFDFQARPFNPHPSSPGQRLHDLLEADKIGRLTGSAIPLDGEMTLGKGGLMQEVLGLQEGGYSTTGFEGHTDDNIYIKYKKKPLGASKAETLRRQKKPTEIIIKFPPDLENDDEIIQYAVKVLIEFF